jgi:DNA-binding transcriptional LysR family regulator
MDFRHVRAFIAVAQESSVTKAAERLNISQPPLTRHILQLEEELGLRLFVRHRHGVTLTDSGQRLLDKAVVVASATADFLETAREVKGVRRIRIGVAWGLWEAANSICAEFAKRDTPGTIQASDILCYSHYTEQLRSRSLDVILGRPPFDQSCLSVDRVFEEPIVVLLCQSHPLAQRENLEMRDIANEPLLLWDRGALPVLYDKILGLYERAGIRPSTISTPGAGPYNSAGMMLVASGRGIYLGLGPPVTMPLNSVTSVVSVPLAMPDATSDVCVAWRADETSPMVLQLLDDVRRVFPRRCDGPSGETRADCRASGALR